MLIFGGLTVTKLTTILKMVKLNNKNCRNVDVFKKKDDSGKNV